MPQNERFGARKCLLYDSTLQNEHLGVLTPKNYPKTPLHAEIPAKINILKNSCNFWTNQPIVIKFEIMVDFAEQNHQGTSWDSITKSKMAAATILNLDKEL